MRYRVSLLSRVQSDGCLTMNIRSCCALGNGYTLSFVPLLSSLISDLGVRVCSLLSSLPPHLLYPAIIRFNPHLLQTRVTQATRHGPIPVEDVDPTNYVPYRSSRRKSWSHAKTAGGQTRCQRVPLPYVWKFLVFSLSVRRTGRLEGCR